MHSLYLSYRYLAHNTARTITLIACVTVVSFLPLALELLLEKSEKQLISRAADTPLIVGAKGSALDLAMNTLYFSRQTPEAITMAAADQVSDSDLAAAVPMYVRFNTMGVKIVGTTLDYFDFRHLAVETGDMLSLIGECVVGSKAAESLGVRPGSHLISSPESLFDLTGVYPLKMRVTGVLKRSHTPDDSAVFVDVKTAWIIQGLVHGHEAVQRTEDASVILKRTEQNVTANAKLFHYTEITRENMDSFHFHGDASEYPLTAVMAFPFDDKSGTILMGRYLKGDNPLQIIRPKETIAGLMETIFRFKTLLDAVILTVGTSTLMAVVLVFSLSLRLRQREMQTIFRLGCQKRTMASLVFAEIAIISALSAAVCAVLMFVVNQHADQLVRIMFIR